MFFNKHRKTESRSAESIQILQSINKFIRILVKLKISQNYKKLDYLCLLSQIIANNLNIIKFFTQDIEL